MKRKAKRIRVRLTDAEKIGYHRRLALVEAEKHEILAKARAAKKARDLTEQTADELAESTAEFDEEGIPARFRALTPEEREAWERRKPLPDAHGNYPAFETITHAIVMEFFLRRRNLRLSQAALARRARISPQTLRRIEQGRQAPKDATVAKIERALSRSEKKATKKIMDR